MRWSCADIADAVAAGLKEQAARDDLEQAVYGFDARDELGLHPLLHDALRQAEYGVWPEQRYPSDRDKPRRSEGKRCDMVLTRSPDLPLKDPLVTGTLFDNQPAAEVEQAYWLEVKLVAQFETEGPFPRYSAELMSPVTQDIRKIWTEPLIVHGGLLLVLFCGDQQIAEHDMGIWHERCMHKGFPVAPPAARGFAITDRIGNGWCQIGVFGIRGV